MPVGLPIDDAAVQNLIAAIDATTEDDHGVSLRCAQLDPDGTTMDEAVVNIEMQDEEPLERSPCGKNDFYVVLNLHAYAASIRKGAAGSIEQKLRIRNAAIRKALGSDVTRGGYAVNTQFGTTTYFLGNDPAAAVIPVKLYVRTAYNDRFSQ